MNKRAPKPRLALTCASSGLPIGYVPPARAFASYQPHISFGSFSIEDVRGLVNYALNDQNAQDIDAKYAFMGLLHKIPEQILQIKNLPRPDWEHRDISYLLRPAGLRIFASFVERCISEKPETLQYLSAYRISSEYHTDNRNLHGFPRMLAVWVGALANLDKLKEAERRSKPRIELFKRRRPLKNEIYSIFDSRRSSAKQLLVYSAQLADFYDREDSILWHQFVTQPITFPVKKIEDFLRNIKAWNSGLDRIDEYMQLSYSFATWLESALEQAKAEQLQSFELTRAVSLDSMLTLQEEGVPEDKAQQLAKKYTDVNEPQIHQFESAMKYLAALKKYRAQRKAQQA